MPHFLADILTQLKAIWLRLDGGQRLTIIAVLTATVVGIVAMIWYAGQSTLMVLRSGDPGYLAQVGSVLEKEGVVFKPSGNSIMIDRRDQQAAQSALTRAGVPGPGGSDKSFFDSMMSSAEDRAALRMLRLQDQAARALKGMRGIREASVQASKPPRSTFRVNDAETQPRATALIRIASGVSFSRVARNAAELVASTIGMPKEHVTVIDMDTQARMAGSSDVPANDSSSFRAEERDLEMARQEKALQLLGPLRSKVRVSVTVQLDPEYTSTRRKYLPTEPVLLQESSSREETKGSVSGSAPGGDPSVTPAVAGGSGSSGRGVGKSNKKTTSDKTYDPDLGTVIEGLMAPKIKKISLSLSIDQSLKDKADDIKSVVMDAVGFEGDASEVPVLVMDFPEPEPMPQHEGPGVLDSMMSYLPIAAQLVGVLLVLLFLKSMLKRTQVTPLPALPKEEELSIDDLDDANLTPDETAKRMRKEIEKAINEDPATISRMLENWLAEQKV